MARPLRLEYPGAVYHVTSRGNAGQNIFTKAADKDEFLQIMSACFSRFGWICYAWCLMDNHYHLVVETPQANLSKGMKQLNSQWAQRFNRRNERSGHLFQGRFNALIIERESYLLEALRYVVLNPVRAEICRQPQDYRYSSYNKTAGLGNSDDLVSTDWVLAQFGQNKAVARAEYAQFVKQAIGGCESLLQKVRAQLFLGSDEFVADLTLDLADESLREIPKAQRPDPKPPLGNLIKSKKDKNAMNEAYRDWGYTLAQIADHLGIHYSTVSRAIKQIQQQV